MGDLEDFDTRDLAKRSLTDTHFERNRVRPRPQSRVRSNFCMCDDLL